jgi:hypothetical protein
MAAAVSCRYYGAFSQVPWYWPAGGSGGACDGCLLSSCREVAYRWRCISPAGQAGVTLFQQSFSKRYKRAGSGFSALLATHFVPQNGSACKARMPAIKCAARFASVAAVYFLPKARCFRGSVVCFVAV